MWRSHVRIWETCFSTILRRTIRKTRPSLRTMWRFAQSVCAPPWSTSTAIYRVIYRTESPSNAEAAGMRPQHFANMFRKSMGTSPVANAREQRIELAMRLLAETTSPSWKSPIETGFPNQSHFSEMFPQ